LFSSTRMISFGLFMVLYVVSLVLATLAGLVILVGYDDLYLRRALHSLRVNVAYILILAALPLAIILIDTLVPQSTNSVLREYIYTSWLYQFGGGAIRILQNWLNYGLFTDIFIFAYVWIFAFVTFFSPILLLARDDRPTLRRYTIALMFNYLILIPFIIFVPVSVPSDFPESGVTPLLYVKSNWGRMVTGIDPLNNGFPSGHTSLCIATVLTFALAGRQYRRYSYFLVGVTASIVLSVLYLGIHWPMDVLFGAAVGVFVVVLSRTERVRTVIESRLDRLTSKVLGKEAEGLSSIGSNRP
jgi:membrane-associated phospholipid phosphatase